MQLAGLSGSALGVAVIGSVAASLYGRRLPEEREAEIGISPVSGE